VKSREAKGLADSSELTERSDRPNLYISSFIPLERLVLKTILPLSVLLCLSMATVNMNCVEFYNPNLALKASHAQLTRLVLNKHRTPLQPSKSPSRDADLARNVQDNDSLDDSLPSLDELFQASRNGDIPQVPHQNHKPVHISKRQLIDESRLVTDSTTPNPVYVLGNSQRRFLARPCMRLRVTNSTKGSP
jgi:hypothetical protein